MIGLKERLGRLTRSVSSAAPKSEPSLEASAEPEQEAWEQLGFKLQSGPEGACLVRESHFRPSFRHGMFTVSELESAGKALKRLNPAGAEIDPAKLLFLDTETTGLGQGAGIVPFLIGIGWWEEEGFKVRQYFIRHPGEEAAMLAKLKDMLPSFTHLVTYNGRSFDWPLVKNRYVMHRMPMPKDLQHFDFLYPSRSLWRTTMPSCRLGAVEEAKLGVIREEDVPGSAAPALYFQYLAERDVSVLAGVFEHNEKDLLTLLSLAIHFGRLLEGGVDAEALESAELLRLALWYERLGIEKEAEAMMAVLAARPVSEASAELGEAALFYKRRKRWPEAIRLWRELAEYGSGRRAAPLEPLIELAMAYEHRVKNLEEALYWTNEALRIAERRLSLVRFGENGKLRSQLKEIRKRKARLMKKLGGFQECFF